MTWPFYMGWWVVYNFPFIYIWGIFVALAVLAILTSRGLFEPAAEGEGTLRGAVVVAFLFVILWPFFLGYLVYNAAPQVGVPQPPEEPL